MTMSTSLNDYITINKSIITAPVLTGCEIVGTVQDSVCEGKTNEWNDAVNKNDDEIHFQC